MQLLDGPQRVSARCESVSLLYVRDGVKRGRKYCPSPSLPAADIEAAVVDQIRCIADDPGLRRDVLEQSGKRCEAELAELNTQRMQLTQRLNHSEDFTLDGARDSDGREPNQNQALTAALSCVI